MRVHASFAALFLLLAAALPARAEPKQKIAVLGLKAAKGIDEDTVKLLDELLLTQIQEAGDFEVFGSSDIASMITLEEQRVQLTGCTDDSCLAEIGGALGVNLLIASSVGAVGDKFLLNVKLLDVTTAKVLKRSSDVIDGQQSKLIDAIKGAAAKVTADLAGVKTTEDKPDPLGTGSAEPPPPPPPTPPPPEPQPEDKGSTSFLDVAPWLALGLAVVAAGAGGAMLGIGQSDKAEMKDTIRGNEDWADLQDSAETKSLAGGVLLGVAGAAAVGTVVLFLVGGDDDEAKVAVLPVHGGMMATLGFGF